MGGGATRLQGLQIVACELNRVQRLFIHVEANLMLHVGNNESHKLARTALKTHAGLSGAEVTVLTEKTKRESFKRKSRKKTQTAFN